MTDTNPHSKTTSVTELLEISAQTILDHQRTDGSFPPGRNGPYEEAMTPVRSTARWLEALTAAYESTGSEEFARAANRAADYLLESENRPHGYTFYARKSPGKDKCNQLVGQALPIKALAGAGTTFDRPDLIDTAVEVFKLHPFNPELGLWEKVEIDGTKLSFDRTLNHQLLFAGAGSYLAAADDDIEWEVSRHLDKLGEILETRRDGIIRHYVRPSIVSVVQTVLEEPRHWELLLNELMHVVLTLSPDQRRKEIGYQPLNLFALSWLKINFPQHAVWTNGGENWSVDGLFPPILEERVFDPDIRLGAGQPGISTAIGLHVLVGCEEEVLREWVERDIDSMYDPETGLLDDVENDPMGHAAGINRLSYLPDFEIELPSSDA